MQGRTAITRERSQFIGDGDVELGELIANVDCFGGETVVGDVADCE